MKAETMEARTVLRAAAEWMCDAPAMPIEAVAEQVALTTGRSVAAVRAMLAKEGARLAALAAKK